jgi:aminopeptidase
MLTPGRLTAATRHVDDILRLAIEHLPDGEAGGAEAEALIIADARCDLARILGQAYAAVLPKAHYLDFDAYPQEAVLEALAQLKSGDLAVLVQSTHFRLAAFRLRVELFKRGIKVIEHLHLERMVGDEVDAYIDALAYDPDYLRKTGQALKARIDRAEGLVLDTGAAQLVYAGGFESAKLNVGDYRGMTNVGGLFPIGEVFTEARDLTAVGGRLRIFAFADTEFKMARIDTPITLIIEAGRVVAAENSVPGFDGVLRRIREDEGEVWVRELGFGLNRAFSPTRMVSDVGTYERMCGVHFSLGAKHAVYEKPGFKRKATKHHVDVFAATESVLCDGESLFVDGRWVVNC